MRKVGIYMHQIDSIMSDIEKYIEKKREIYTISQRKLNVVKSISYDEYLVETDKGETIVKKEWIKTAIRILIDKGKICTDDLLGFPARYRSSFIFALLNCLDCIESITENRKTYIRIKE